MAIVYYRCDELINLYCFYLESMFMVFTRMFFIQPAAASCTRSSSEPVNVSKVCWKQRKDAEVTV